MSDETSSYGRVRERLEEIVVQIRSKDVPLEKSLDLYEEALRLGGLAAEMIDNTDFTEEELSAVPEIADDLAAEPEALDELGELDELDEPGELGEPGELDDPGELDGPDELGDPDEPGDPGEQDGPGELGDPNATASFDVLADSTETDNQDTTDEED
ncbi:MAG: exodeoxyribonuclease VII small subunit [Coriobacteriales bacterium]|jgi:exodeoxyribonuclease VII small subunit|nr:exodeoxyribonuclease VII small subunit [Coriobacteriales bacterium]